MKKEKILEIQKVSNEYHIIYNETERFKRPGVWFMHNESELLEVAQTSNIYEELQYDISWIMKKYPVESDRTKKYTARRLFTFSKRFDVLNCDINRTTAKYRNIAEETSEKILVYVILENSALSANKEVRERIELETAINNGASYWNAFGIQRKQAIKYYESMLNAS